MGGPELHWTEPALVAIQPGGIQVCSSLAPWLVLGGTCVSKMQLIGNHIILWSRAKDMGKTQDGRFGQDLEEMSVNFTRRAAGNHYMVECSTWSSLWR